MAFFLNIIFRNVVLFDVKRIEIIIGDFYFIFEILSSLTMSKE
jgi:hypothetical protein